MTFNPLIILLCIPLAGIVLVLLLRPFRNFFAFLTSLAFFCFGLYTFITNYGKELVFSKGWFYNFQIFLRWDHLSSAILLFVGFFAALISLYSLGKKFSVTYNVLFLLTVFLISGAILSASWIFLLFCWGFSALTLYGFVLLKKEFEAAKKAFIMLLSTDILMLLGLILLISQFAGDSMLLGKVPPESKIFLASFLLILCAIVAKAGAIPFHTWIPAMAEGVNVEVLALFPAAMDKLVGIYLLARISKEIFIIPQGSFLSYFLMLLGSATIVIAVIMALVQHNYKKLLSYHAVSQVGYMILGIGTLNPVGFAGGLFHMINNTIYKTCLFLSAGNAEEKTGEADLDRMGGLGKKMPFSFLSFFLAALAISGIPPLNGFFSKWMVYQGVISLHGKVRWWPLFLLCAMFGSALTLASFVKVMHSIFLGRLKKEHEDIKEAKIWRLIPILILAFLCVILGLKPSLVIDHLIYPFTGKAEVTGFWVPVTAFALMILALVVGLFIILIAKGFKGRKVDTFYGGEKIESIDYGFSGSHFYSSLKHTEMINETLVFAQGGAFDVYNYWIGISRVVSRLLYYLIDRPIDKFYEFTAWLTVQISKGFSKVHNGLLPFYLSWILIAFVIIILLSIK